MVFNSNTFVVKSKFQFYSYIYKTNKIDIHRDYSLIYVNLPSKIAVCFKF